MTKCDHSEVICVGDTPGGRKQWLCACGRNPTAAPDVERNTLIAYMRRHDELMAVALDSFMNAWIEDASKSWKEMLDEL